LAFPAGPLEDWQVANRSRFHVRKRGPPESAGGKKGAQYMHEIHAVQALWEGIHILPAALHKQYCTIPGRAAKPNRSGWGVSPF